MLALLSPMLLSSFLVAAPFPTPPPVNLQATVQSTPGTPDPLIDLDLGWATEHLSFYLEPGVDVQSLTVRINRFPAVEWEEYNVSSAEVAGEQVVVVSLCSDWQMDGGVRVQVRYRRK